jgi:hypothetical protein
MGCSRRMEKIIWNDRLKKKEVLHIVKEEKNILHPACYILERGSVISQSVGNSLSKKLWTCPKTDEMMNKVLCLVQYSVCIVMKFGKVYLCF